MSTAHRVPLDLTIHQEDYKFLVEAAKTAHCDVQAFAELAVYRFSRDTLNLNGVQDADPGTP